MKLFKYFLIIIAFLGLFGQGITLYAQTPSPNDRGTCVTPSTNIFGKPSTITTLTTRGNCSGPNQRFSPNSAGVQGAEAVTTQVQTQAEAQAQNPPSTPVYTTDNYTLLAPLPCGKNTPATGCEGGLQKNIDPTKGLGAYLNIMIKIFIGLCAVMAVVMIVMGGIEYMTSELISSKEAGRDRITNAVLGLILALGSYALLYTINPDLLNTDVNVADVHIAFQEDVPQAPINGTFPDGSVYNTPWNDTTGPLTPMVPHITSKQPECTFIGQSNCTSTRVLNLSSAINVQRGCNCDIVITGGTETWLHGGATGHTSHRLQSSTIDLRRLPQTAETIKLDNYLSGGKPLVMDTWYPSSTTQYFYFEGDHWHVK
ncbi:MAG: pilin [Patescibacteria group bacterium]